MLMHLINPKRRKKHPLPLPDRGCKHSKINEQLIK